MITPMGDHQTWADWPQQAEREDLLPLLRSFAAELGADAAMLVYLDADGQPVAGETWSSRPRAEVAGALGPFARRVLESDTPLLEQLPHGWLSRAVGAPLRSPNGLEGSLCAGFEHPTTEGSDGLRWTASAYAGVAALWRPETVFMRTLVSAARFDGLTGLLNFSGLRDALDEELQRARRHGRPLSLCFVDLDNFKRLNDSHGHPYGNRVLAAIGLALRHELRTSDRAGRYGGDEFLLVLPETPADGAETVANRVRAAITTASERETGDLIDASAGIAEWVPDQTVEDLLGEADAALRMAKESGRGVAISPVTAPDRG
jgi:diguanylate cyclase (GGDEF)-like protein